MRKRFLFDSMDSMVHTIATIVQFTPRTIYNLLEDENDMSMWPCVRVWPMKTHYVITVCTHTYSTFCGSYSGFVLLYFCLFLDFLFLGPSLKVICQMLNTIRRWTAGTVVFDLDSLFLLLALVGIQFERPYCFQRFHFSSSSPRLAHCPAIVFLPFQCSM